MFHYDLKSKYHKTNTIFFLVIIYIAYAHPYYKSTIKKAYVAYFFSCFFFAILLTLIFQWTTYFQYFLLRATQGIVKNVPSGTKNKLVYDACVPETQNNLSVFSYATSWVSDSFAFVKNLVKLIIPASIL